MKNKKGFTLVELLAVIVILGILLLIAVPAVQNIIQSSRKKAFESNAKLVLENVQEIVSIETTTESSIRPCYIPLTKINLERGSLDHNNRGFVTVNPTSSGVTIRIYYANGQFTTLRNVDGNNIGATLEDINAGLVQKSTTYPSTQPAASSVFTEECSFYTG